MEPRLPGQGFAYPWPVSQARQPVLREQVGLALATTPSPGDHLWAEGLLRALTELRADLCAPDRVDGRGDALNLAVLAAAPRLANAIGRHTRHQRRIVGMVDLLVHEVSATDPPVPMIRDRGTVLLGQLERHRQRGSDLLHEAHLEMGGES
jgi:hypothetical protein